MSHSASTLFFKVTVIRSCFPYFNRIPFPLSRFLRIRAFEYFYAYAAVLAAKANSKGQD